MATYRALLDIYPGGNWPYAPAGTILSDGVATTVPQNVPQNWTPANCVDPLDQDAINKFWTAGVQLLPGPMRVAFPAIYWKLADPKTLTYQLTGAGAALGVRNLGNGGAAP